MKLPQNQKTDKTILICTSLAFILSFLALEAFPLTILWVYASAFAYFLSVTMISIALFFLKSYLNLVLFLGLSCGIVGFSYFLNQKYNLIISLWLSVGLAFFAMGGCFYVFSLLNASDLILEQLETLKNKAFSIKALSSLTDQNKELLSQQIPSSLLIFLGSFLFLSRVFLTNLKGLIKKSTQSGDMSLGDSWQDSLKIPFFFIWLFALSLIGTFFMETFESFHKICINTLNLILFTYFLQGFAILKKYFQTFQIGVNWRLLSYVAVFTFGLFLPLSFIGLVEEWVPFRQKLNNRKKNHKKRKNKELL